MQGATIAAAIGAVMVGAGAGEAQGDRFREEASCYIPPELKWLTS